MSDAGDSLKEAIVDGQPAARDVEGRRLLASLRERMFGVGGEDEPVEVGRYHIKRRLGQGGMGVVYEAHDPELDRTVAVKLVRPGPGARRERPARLLREAQALALLTHPNVVPIYDAGRHGDQVFLAMAYIEGKTLDQWQAQLRAWPDVVRHYLAAGRGLAAAHAAGMVHRDFKPANVMLANDGRVLVMDFGLVAGQATGKSQPSGTPVDLADIAMRMQGVGKAAAPPAWEALTRSGQVVGTYSYMAPEQHEGQAADALADQFSFCAAFLEALQGEFPFVGDTPGELYESKRSGRFVLDPPRTRIPRRLRRVLLRGLQADPDERWSDLDTLLAAVERSSRRTWWLAGGAAVGCAATLGALWLFDGGEASCRGDVELEARYGERQRVAIRESFADTGVTYAADVAAVVVTTLDRYAESWVRARNHACTLDVAADPFADRRRRCLEGRKRDLLAVVEVASAANEALVEEGVVIASRLPAVERCGDPRYLSSEVHWPEDPETSEAVEALRNQVVMAGALGQAGRVEQARAVLVKAQAGAAVLDIPALIAEVEHVSGNVEHTAGNLADAAETLEQAYFRAVGAGHHTVAARAATSLVFLYGVDRGQSAQARVWARHARGPVEELGGAPADRASLEMALGSVFLREGDHDAAVESFEKALAGLKARHGSNHPDVARCLQSLGAAAEARGRFEDAVEYHRQSLEIVEGLLGPSHPERARNLNNLANAQQRVGRTAEALQNQREALRIRRAVFGAEHVEVGESLANLGVLLQEADELEEAAEVQRRALHAFESSLGAEHPSVAAALINLATTLNERGEHLGANTALDRAARILDATLPDDHPYRVFLAKERAVSQTAAGDSPAADETLRAALELCDRRPDDTGVCVEVRIALAERVLPTEAEEARALAVRARADLEALQLRDPGLRKRIGRVEEAVAAADSPRLAGP